MISVLGRLIELTGSLSNKETIELTSSFAVLSSKQFSCTNCKKQASMSPKGERYVRERKGCFGVVSNTVFKVPKTDYLSGINFNTCPVNLSNNEFMILIKQSTMFKQGFLPYSGGFDDQPAKFIEIMEVIEGLRDLNEKKTKETLERLNNGKRSQR